MSHAELRRLDAVAAALPFAVDDYAAANAAFVTWHATRASRRIVDLWAYCYVQRYFLTRFVRETGGSPSDLDVVITTAFERVHKSLDSIRDPARFAQFVSVVCKNTLLNNRTRRRRFSEVDEATPAETVAPAEGLDAPIVRQAVAVAIAALPEGIRETARMRFLEAMGYPEMAARTGKEVPILRAYVAKAARRLRDDPTLRAFRFTDVLPPGVSADEPPE